MAEKISTRIAIDDSSTVERSLTDKPPAHFTLKMDSFSLLHNIIVIRARAQSYESEVFEAGGYKWKLSLYPNGDKEKNAEGFISLYLEIVDTQDLLEDWEVVANLKFFVYDKFKNKYLTIQDASATASRFDAKNTGVGFARVLPYSSFWYAGNGYLVNDQCIFGAEVLVKNYIGTGCTVESLALVKASYTWKIEKFSSLSQAHYFSDPFTIGNRNWKLSLYPKGTGSGKNHTLSVFLVPQDLKLFPEGKIFGKFELCTVNQGGGKDMQRCLVHCFSNTSPHWGFPVFTPLAYLQDASKGFLVNDTLIIRARVDVLSTVRSSISMTNQTEATKIPQEKVKTQTKGKKKSSSKGSGSGAPKETKSQKPSWFKKWFF